MSSRIMSDDSRGRVSGRYRALDNMSDMTYTAFHGAPRQTFGLVGGRVEVFPKKTRATPKSVIEACKRRLGLYDEATK